MGLRITCVFGMAVIFGLILDEGLNLFRQAVRITLHLIVHQDLFIFYSDLSLREDFKGLDNEGQFSFNPSSPNFFKELVVLPFFFHDLMHTLAL